ncbi:MAG TPA: hypothetical protein VF167_00870 [Longimicrobiaceae bacterium]
MARVIALLALLLSLLPATAGAQVGVDTLRTGDDVRVFAPSVRSGRVRGTVVLYEGSTLEVRERRTGALVSFPIASIHALSRNEGVDRGRSSWRMARFGAFVGGAGGLVSGPLIATSRAPERFAEAVVVSGVVGTAAGAGIGAILGMMFAQDQWQHYRMPISATVTSVPGGFGLTLSAIVP